ncbi:AAA family ATPase [Candidatus Symbiopectobacterium endolongispinus]
MRVGVMEHYGLAQPIDQAGYYETDHHKQLIKDIRGAIHEGRLIAVCGVVGSGKTVTMRRLQQSLREENKITVARSLSIEKSSIKLATLISALFYDLTQDKQVQIPKQGERRERELQELVKKGKRPVALFVDEAHDLNGHTLTGLKRLMEVVEDGGGRLLVVLAGHPKLRNDLRRPTMEEIGYRTDIFTLDGIAGSQREYIQWLLKSSMGKGKSEDILTADAIDLLAMKLRTPLQVQQNLTLALEAGYQTGEKPITAALVESVLSRQLDDLEPTLTRHGYRLKDMVEQFDAKPAEIRALFNNQLDPARAAELRDRMLAVGLQI